MHLPGPPDSIHPPDSIGLNVRLITLNSQTERAEGVVRMAHALVEGGRRVDMAGLEHTVGQICAGCLDLGPDNARGLRPRLEALLAAMDALTRALQQKAIEA